MDVFGLPNFSNSCQQRSIVAFLFHLLTVTGPQIFQEVAKGNLGSLKISKAY